MQQSAVTESRIKAGQRQGVAAASVVVVNNRLFKLLSVSRLRRLERFLHQISLLRCDCIAAGFSYGNMKAEPGDTRKVLNRHGISFRPFFRVGNKHRALVFLL